MAQEGPVAPHHPVPDRAAPPLRGRRGADRGRGQGAWSTPPPSRRRHQPAPEPRRRTARCSPTRCAPPPARPTVRAIRARHPSRCALPEGGTERNIVDTVRWTQQQLLAADDRVVILGEDVGPRGGVFRATDNLSEEFGQARVLDTPLAESSIIGIGIGLAMAGLRPDRRDPVRRLHPLGLRPAGVGGGPDPLPEQRRLRGAAGGAGPLGWWRARRAVPLAVHRGHLRPHPGLEGRRPVDARRCVRDAPHRHRGCRPGAVPRAQEDLPPHLRSRPRRRRLAGADRARRGGPRG